MKKALSGLLLLILLISSFTNCFIVYAETEIESPKISSYCSVTSHPVIKWKAVKSVKTYNIYRSTSQDGEYKLVKTVDQKTKYVDSKAKLKNTYYYYVTSVGGAESAPSNIVKQKAKKTILVGDSIMHGVKEFNALPNGKFVTKIGIGPNSFYNFAYNDYKVNGKPSSGVKKVISTDADRIFIMLGMNEIDWNSKARTISNYKKVLTKIQKSLPNAEIVVLATSPTGEKRGSGIPSLSKVNAYNKDVKKLCKELGVAYYDYTDVFKNDNGYLSKKYNGGDGCHWNVSGTKLFVKQIKRYTKKNP